LNEAAIPLTDWFQCSDWWCSCFCRRCPAKL